VCARIACGLSMDGIAADLGIAKSSVLTLRKRAYNKLALHSRMDLVRRFH
jgi:DNA-binding NarL/FixJ family response regulator